MGEQITLRDPRRCTAHNRRGELCRNWAVNGTTKCRNHGGESLKGVAHPNWRHGKHCKYLPKHLRKDYERAMADQELFSLHEQIALLSTLEMELTKKLSELEAPPWGQTVDALVDYETAVASKDQGRIDQTFAALRNVIRQGADPAANYEQTWDKLRQLVQEKAKLTTAEHRRMEVLGAYVPAKEVMTFALTMLAGVKDNVTEPKALRNLQDLFNRLVGNYVAVEPVEAIEHQPEAAAG